MADPFYVDRGEVKHHLSRLAGSLQKLKRRADLPTSPTSKETPDGETLFDKSLIQDVINVISELEYQLKELADTFATQSSNAKQLGLTMEELSKRKDIIEAHQKEFDDLRQKFAYQVKGDPYADPSAVVAGFYGQRQPSVRRYEVANKENLGYEGGSMSVVSEKEGVQEPSRVSMHEMRRKKDFSDDDDEDLVEVFEKKNAAALNAEKGPYGKRGRGVNGGWLDRHIPLSKRNRVLLFGVPVIFVVIIVIAVVATTYNT